MLDISIPSSPDQSRRYFTCTVSVFSANGPSNMSWHKALNFVSAYGASVDAQFIVGGGNAAISAMFGYNCSLFLSVFDTMFVCPCREPPLSTYEAVRRDVIRSVRCQRVHFCQRSIVANLAISTPVFF